MAEQHFNVFHSAASEAAEAPPAPLEARLVTLENTLKKLTDNLANLGQVPVSATVAATPKCPPGLAPEPAVPVKADLDVVRSARAAGIPEEQIAEMARLAHQQKPKLPDVPARKTTKDKANPLDESEDEEQEFGWRQEGQVGEQQPVVGGDPMVTAIGKLNQIAAQLATQNKVERSLESLLDGAGSVGSSESSSGGSSKRYAAALKA